MQALFCARAKGGWKRTLALLDLAELQFDRRGAAEDRHRDLEAGPRLIDLLHDAIEGRERAIRHPDLLAHLEGNRRLRPLDALLDLVQDARRFDPCARRRLCGHGAPRRPFLSAPSPLRTNPTDRVAWPARGSILPPCFRSSNR